MGSVPIIIDTFNRTENYVVNSGAGLTAMANNWSMWRDIGANNLGNVGCNTNPECYVQATNGTGYGGPIGMWRSLETYTNKWFPATFRFQLRISNIAGSTYYGKTHMISYGESNADNTWTGIGGIYLMWNASTLYMGDSTGQISSIASPIPSATWYNVRWDISYKDSKVKFWPIGNTEPGGYNLTANRGTGLTYAGTAFYMSMFDAAYGGTYDIRMRALNSTRLSVDVSLLF